MMTERQNIGEPEEPGHEMQDKHHSRTAVHVAGCLVCQAAAREEANPLPEDRIQERVAILFGADDQTCQRCGRSVLGCGAASDPGWYVDTEAQRDDAGAVVKDAADEPIMLTVIFCPTCW